MTGKLSFRISTEGVDSELEPESHYSNCASASSSNSPSQEPPPFSSLYFPPGAANTERAKSCVTGPDFSPLPAALAPAPSSEGPACTSTVEAEVKAALPQDTKGESSSKGVEDGEPPPPYTEGSSPLEGFAYVMAGTGGGAASILTQVQQGGPAPVNTLGGTFRVNRKFFAKNGKLIFGDFRCRG